MITDATMATILVDDQDEALAFYAETLDFETRADEEYEGRRWLVVSPSADDAFRFTLVLADTEEKRTRVGSQVADHVAFVLETDDCRATYETLSERGVTFHGEPTEVPWGVEVTFEDPFGNVFDLVEPASRNR